LKDTRKVEPDTSYWDESGKARFRIFDTYSNNYKCDQTCEDFAVENTIINLNIWYGLFTTLGLGDGWTVAHAAAKLPTTGLSATLDSYLKSTVGIPMDPHSALPLPVRNAARMVDFTMFLAIPNAPKLGTISLGNLEYASLRKYLWDKGGDLLRDMAPAYGVPEKATPLFIKTSSNAILGWGAMPVWVDPISSAPFTFNFVAGASGREAKGGGAGPSAFIEEKMSSTYYHEGLGYITQHYETSSGPTTASRSCAWDMDCAADCEDANCVPLQAAGYDGGKIPGTYFGSAKGQAGLPQFATFVLTYYLVITMAGSGRTLVPALYKGPNAEEETWDFEGWFAISAFKSASFLRRLENCNYPGGRMTENGKKDSPGIDCNFVKDTSPLQPYFGLPLYWNVLIRDSDAPGWDSALCNAEDGANSIRITAQVKATSCLGNKFCTDGILAGKGPGFNTFLSYGYEPNLGALVDVSFVGGLGWKLTPSPRHPHLAVPHGYKYVPLFWFWNYLHLPGAINMDLAKLQLIPAALNGFYIFLLAQCMISLVGGFACCFCGI